MDDGLIPAHERLRRVQALAARCMDQTVLVTRVRRMIQFRRLGEAIGRDSRSGRIARISGIPRPLSNERAAVSDGPWNANVH